MADIPGDGEWGDPFLEEEDIYGLCGEPGADKYEHPRDWPGDLEVGMTRLEEIREIEKKATKGPWRSGRKDMLSYDGLTGEGPWKAVYCDDARGGKHLGKQLPYQVARGEGDECLENAEFIANAREDVPYLLSLVDEAVEVITGLAAFRPEILNLAKVEELMRKVREDAKAKE